MSAKPLRIGLAGLGTVGSGGVKIVQQHADLITKRTGRAVQITAVSARDKSKNRDADLSGYAWETDPVALAKRDDVDIFVEVMGGHEGAAKLATEAAIAAGKDVVTANKALLAHHGDALAAAVPREILIDGHEHGLVDRPSVRLCLLAQGFTGRLVESESHGHSPMIPM